MRIGFTYDSLLANSAIVVNIMRRLANYGDKVYVINAVTKGSQGLTAEKVFGYTPYVDGVYEAAVRKDEDAELLYVEQAKELHLDLFFCTSDVLANKIHDSGITAMLLPDFN